MFNKREDMPNAGDVEVIGLVLEDIKERSEIGKKKYNTLLKANNGRDALIDAYQEALDLVMYLRQELYERYGK